MDRFATDPVPQSFDFTDFRKPLVIGPGPALPSLTHGSSQFIHWVPKPDWHTNPPRTKASDFDIPFLHHDCGDYFQQGSLFLSPFKDLPARSFASSDSGRSMAASHSLLFSNGIHRNHLPQTPPNTFGLSALKPCTGLNRLWLGI